MPSPLDALTQINLDDLVSSLGWKKYPLLTSLLRKTFFRPARKFAGQVLRFDDAVGRSNLAEAARDIMQKMWVQDVRAHGLEHIPRNESALFLSNHPGMADTVSLFAAINRADLKIIALHRPFLELMTNTTKQLFFIDDDPAKRVNAVRQVSNHLKNGGSVLTFPAGEIEPDPDVYPGALDSLNTWTDSAAVFLRFARDVKIIPVLVSGVIWNKAARHWLPRLKRTRFEREKLAAALQLIVIITRDARPNTVHVRFAQPITLEEVGSTDAPAVHRAVLARMREMLEDRTSADVSVLASHEVQLRM
jgi:1-acyl-sn-glycerol-3-phosphate acyltransferase